ncbi:MAG: hypothetical protein KBA02_00085 [Paludibacteraceae bacterium]|nr:hypothetical protein [Paludibacteraceae bacterium]
MEEVKQDVAGSSPEQELQAPAQQDVKPEVQTQDTTAESKNTEKPPAGYVPLQALHEAREQLKELKALQDSQDWKAYQALKNKMETDANFSQFLTQRIQDYVSGLTQQEKDALADYPAEIAEPLRKTQMLEAQVQQLLQATQAQRTEAVLQQYKSAFAERIKDVPSHWKSYYEKRAYEIGGQLNPNALNSFDGELVKNAFEAVDQEVKAIQRAERGMYVTDKTKDNLPPSTSSTGVPGQTVSKPTNEYERARAIEELLKMGQA